MKAETPEKLYVDVHDNLSDSILYGFTEKRTDDDIEYIRTDTLEVKEVQEEPVSNDLEEAVNAYIGYAPEVDECSSVYGERKAFKAGAEWQKKQMIDKACEWLLKNDSYAKPTELLVRNFKKAMEE